jgi:branched-chain amino acid transport system permease protein
MRFDYDTSYRDSHTLLRYAPGRIAYALLVLALIASPWLLPHFYVGEMTNIFIAALAALGLMVLTGYTGQVSLGHSGFLAVGAYAQAWLLARGLPFYAALPAATAITAASGAVIGLPAIRVSGLYLAMVTLAFAVLTGHVIGRWESVTGGFNGLQVENPVLFGLDLSGERPFYYLCLVLLVVVLLGLINLVRSGTGRALVGVRDSEAAAASLGVWVAGYKVLAFVVSAAVTGLAGALMAHQIRFLTPEGFDLILSLQLVLMVTIGGLGSLRGALLGAVVISLLPHLISSIKPLLPARVSGQFGLEIFVFGLVLALFVLFEPAGLNGRWLKLRAWFEHFPLNRRDQFRRVKTYMKSERYR